MANIKKETINYQNMLQQAQTHHATVERKYAKAKRLVRDYQQREIDMVHQEEVYMQLLQEKDTEYNALVHRLKDRVISLEQKLQDTQRRAGFPVELPYDQASSLRLTPQLCRRQPPKPLFQKLDSGLSDTEMSDLSPDGGGDGDDGDDDKTATVERKLPPVGGVVSSTPPTAACADTNAPNGKADHQTTKADDLDAVVPPHDLLDNSATRSKCELVARSLMAGKRQVPSAQQQHQQHNDVHRGAASSKPSSISASSSDCGLNDSDGEPISEASTSTTATDSAHHNGHHNGAGSVYGGGIGLIDNAMGIGSGGGASSPPLYAQVQKDRSSNSIGSSGIADMVGERGGGGGGVGGSSAVLTGGVHHFMAHSTIPNIYKKSQVGVTDGSGLLDSPYDSIMDSDESAAAAAATATDKTSEQQWMYPSRVRRGVVGAPAVGKSASTSSAASFTDQLNQVLSEREK